MKKNNDMLRLLAMAMLLMTSIHMKANKAMTDEYRQHIDSTIQIGLVTCQPAQEVYSLYGHTALHYVNKDNGIDVAINYGLFSFSKPHFVLRFIFGLTDYEMGIQDFNGFCYQYANHQRGIIEQIVDLPAEGKLKFAEAVERNYRPENREYRYNYFYDNCTTRARDILLGDMKQSVVYPRKNNGPSFREMIHQYNEEHPWARFGNDMLLGMMADRPTTISEQQFLPDNLMRDFENAILEWNGERHPIVKETRTLVPVFQQTVESEFPLRPRDCFMLLLVVTIAITITERIIKRRIWVYDMILMIAAGLAGCILFLMLFSQHPTVRLNLQLLLLNPLPLFMIRHLFTNRKKASRSRREIVSLVLICLFFVGGAFQCYAEGMYLVASSLLIRNIVRLI